MEKVILNVYDDNDKVIKTCEAQFAKIRFGTIRAIMKLLKIDQIKEASELTNTVYNAWDKIVSVLDKCFPDMEEKDWDNVDFGEVTRALLGIAKMTFAKMTEVPRDEKNSTAE